VVFKRGLTTTAIARHKQYVTNNSIFIDRHYSIGQDFDGYAAHMGKDAVALLLQSKEVDFVEEDGVMRAFESKCNTQEGSTWGIVRTSGRNLNLNGKYDYPDDAVGELVTAYVIDTGILTTHVEFQTDGPSRAKWGGNFVDQDNTDGNGHGTHCAGTIGGKTYGMAKNVRLVAVKVLNKQGSGSTAGVINGVDFAAKQAALDGTPSLGSMSLGGGKSAALNAAVDAAATSDPPLHMIVAAGNDNKDAANVSPASSDFAICVAASDNTDKKATFSNWGPKVAIYGPGVGITSAWIGSNTATNTISGTSMACPHVAGQVAKYLQLNTKATVSVVKGWLKDQSSKGIITNGAIGGTPNNLLFADCNTFPRLASNSSLKLQKRY
jgi:subtilisin family serine protease